ncbi:DNA-binding transcriptional LysR family regulator [Paenibacillus shirakamiensis]|uniref:DNA-binding transcriptional LysR family regulator n=1 Tax=Paenibacillus shirakamiensis TaxID=1265935 RepID=A0ABS4JGA5_9BACL|nr:LysR family transcriptional regulator [Paenibacillus shirakamiensis]MBP2000742.1 DNA-binding transcriptional LysR family regulator [Paenibacillus shirakamiensis]
MELVYLQTFREVARLGSYTKAAEALGYAQSSVTTQIQKLEESYRTVLFERFGRTMRLTQAGEALLPFAHEMIRLHAESKEVVAEQSKGSLNIGTIETLAAFYLPPFLQAYRKNYPDIQLLIQPGNELVIIEGVKNGTVDVGFILDPPLQDPQIHSIILREEPIVIAMSPDHRLASVSGLHLSDLEQETFILTEAGCTYRSSLLDLLNKQGISFQISCEFGNLEAIKQCVIYGLGVALLPGITLDHEVRQGKLAAIPILDPDMKFYTQLIYSRKKWLSKSFQNFLQLLHPEYSSK